MRIKTKLILADGRVIKRVFAVRSESDIPIYARMRGYDVAGIEIVGREENNEPLTKHLQH